MFLRMALIGCGMMGGSLALAMRRARLVQQVVGYSPNADDLRVAIDRGVIDAAAATVADAVRRADFVVLAVPVAVTRQVLQELAPWLRPDAIIMDVGSTKQNVIAAAQEAGADLIDGGQHHR